MSRSSLNSTNVPEILGASHLFFRAVRRSTTVVCVAYFCLRDLERQSLIELMIVLFALVH